MLLRFRWSWRNQYPTLWAIFHSRIITRRIFAIMPIPRSWLCWLGFLLLHVYRRSYRRSHRRRYHIHRGAHKKGIPIAIRTISIKTRWPYARAIHSWTVIARISTTAKTDSPTDMMVSAVMRRSTIDQHNHHENEEYDHPITILLAEIFHSISLRIHNRIKNLLVMKLDNTIRL